MVQLEARGVIFRKVKKKRHSFFISDLEEDENSFLLEEETQDSDVKRKEEEKQGESVYEPSPNSPPSTIMDFVRAELDQMELRLANKIMTNLEGKYLEMANTEKVLIERLERQVDFLKSEIQNKNNQISSMLGNMDISKANFQNIEEENKGGACKNNARSCTDKTYEWRQVIPKILGMTRPSMAKKPSNEFDWHANYEDFPPLSNKFDLLLSLDLHDTGDYFLYKILNKVTAAYISCRGEHKSYSYWFRERITKEKRSPLCHRPQQAKFYCGMPECFKKATGN